MAKPNLRTIIHDPKYAKTSDQPEMRIPDDDIKYSTMAVGEEGELATIGAITMPFTPKNDPLMTTMAIGEEGDFPQPVGLIAPPGWNDGKVLKPYEPPVVSLTMAMGENGEIQHPVGLIAPPSWQKHIDEVPVGFLAEGPWGEDGPVGLVAQPVWRSDDSGMKPYEPGPVMTTMAIGENGEIQQPVVGTPILADLNRFNVEVAVGIVLPPHWNTDKSSDEILKAQIEAKQIEEIQTNKDLFNFQQLNHVSNEQIAAIKMANPDWKDQLKEWTAAHREEIHSMPIGAIAVPFPARSDGDEAVVGRTAPGGFDEGMVGLVAGPDWGQSDQDQTHVRGRIASPEWEQPPTIPIAPSVNDEKAQWIKEIGVKEYQNYVDVHPVAVSDVLHGTAIANQIFGKDVVSAAIDSNPGGSAVIAAKLDQFQENSHWTTEQMHDYVKTHSDWEDQLNKAVPDSQVLQPEIQMVGLVVGPNWEQRATGLGELPSHIAEAQWGQAIGQEQVNKYENAHPEASKSIIDGTVLANDIFGKDVVSAAIHTDGGHSASLAAKLDQFQEHSGWSTERMKEYVNANSNWEEQLNVAVAEYDNTSSQYQEGGGSADGVESTDHHPTMHHQAIVQGPLSEEGSGSDNEPDPHHKFNID